MNEIITAGEKCPMLTFVDSFKTTSPLPENPTNAINTPIPPVTACFIFSGIEFTTVSRILKSVKTINIIPSQNTAVKAVCQLIPPFNTTVNAKNAFNPIPEARAKGKFAISPIRKHPSAAEKQVAVTNAPAFIPVFDKIFGFTAIMYAIVRNVVIPAIISFFILTFSFVKSGKSRLSPLVS